MTGQGNILETRLAELTQEIRILNRMMEDEVVNTPDWHRCRNQLRPRVRERNKILEQKKAR